MMLTPHADYMSKMTSVLMSVFSKNVTSQKSFTIVVKIGSSICVSMLFVGVVSLNLMVL